MINRVSYFYKRGHMAKWSKMYSIKFAIGIAPFASNFIILTL